MSKRLQLTQSERRELKDIFLQMWHETGEYTSKSSGVAEVTDLWFNAVSQFLVIREERLKSSEDASKDTKD